MRKKTGGRSLLFPSQVVSEEFLISGNNGSWRVRQVGQPINAKPLDKLLGNLGKIWYA